MAIVDVKITLRSDDDGYSVELSSTQPDSDAEIAVETPGAARLNLQALQLESDPQALGAALSKALFETPEILAAFTAARSVADSTPDGDRTGVPLRLRLQIDPGAAELHALRWETLRDPAGDAPLILGERVRFSRFLASADWRKVQRLPRSELRALVAVAAPTGLATFGLAELDVAAEVQRARVALGDIPVAALAERGRVTLNGLVAALRDGLGEQRDFAVLYLVAHGALVASEETGEPEPWLFLEGEDGQVARVRGADLAEQIGELAAPPRLVVLASCQSAGTGEQAEDGAPLTALGPRLARAGVPAVIAMQGKVSLSTAAAFTRAFFEQLRKDGQIDRAVAVARGTVRDAPDAWMPVLFMRLRSGQLWYEPGFTVDKPLEKWDAVLSRAYNGKCTPILGDQLSAGVYDSPREIAQRWATRHAFPLAPHQKGELAYVAQYLSIKKDPLFPRDQYLDAVRRSLISRYKADLPPPLASIRPPLPPLENLLAKVAEIRRAKGALDSYAALAALPCAIYVTVATDNLLEESLKAAGKSPRTELCRWNEDLIAEVPSAFDDKSYTPDAWNPLVFHLFGSVTRPRSLVITEDDYFDFLIGVTRNNDMVPPAVREALVDAVLLFVGFRLEDWSFRVLFRSLMSAGGGVRRNLYTSVAGQVLPEETQFLAPQAAANYLEEYFDDSKITIFWGSVEDFAGELSRRWEEYCQKQEEGL